jgi:hypothetical protein
MPLDFKSTTAERNSVHMKKQWGHTNRKMEHSLAAFKLKRELEAELADNGADLVWSAADAARIDRAMAVLDRITDLQAAYDRLDPEEVKLRVALSTELRLHDTALSRIVGQIDTGAPEPAATPAHIRAQRAAMARHHPNAGKDTADGAS